jgi:O-antigen biosynthesis protein
MISVFTPSHNPRWLDDCYSSLLDQTEIDWEWVVLLNDHAHWTPPADGRVKVHHTDTTGVGALKREAVEWCQGDILVELDHDDILGPHCLKSVAKAITDGASVVYSDFAQMDAELRPNFDTFLASHGWAYHPDGEWLVCESMAPTPHNMSYVWYEPNHVRAFRRDLYEKVEGYDPHLTVLDDQDLLCRLYAADPRFTHLPRCLYYQRIHPDNTQRQSQVNPFIQSETVRLYDKYVEGNALAWTEREGLLALDLGSAHAKPKGYMGVDVHPGSDITGDIFDVLADTEDDSVGVVRAVDFLEHITDKVRLFNELYRVMAHGSLLLSLTPSTDGRGAYQDPTHVAFYNENSFWYFTDREYAKFVPAIRCRFQVSRLVTYFPSPWHENNRIPYVCANLIAIKDGPRQGGILTI